MNFPKIYTNIRSEVQKNIKIYILSATLIIFFVLCFICCFISMLIDFDDNNQSVLGQDIETESQQPEITKSEEIIFIEEKDNYKSYNLDLFSDSDLYKVIKIVDGDTIEVQSKDSEKFTLRLIGLDTPETKDPRKPVECFGTEASKRAEDLLLDKKVYLLADESQDNTDKYDRLLRYIIREDGYFFNLNMIADGYANEYTYQVPYQFSEEFKAAESSAVKDELGLFGQACECAEQKDDELSRSCIACNKAEVTLINYDCSEYKKEIDDSNCANLCPQSESPIVTVPTTSQFTCDCSKTCSQMISCNEAYFQLNQCGCTRRDGDNDGVPCENICPGG